MKTRTIAIAASAALALAPLIGVTAASATTAPEEVASSTASPVTDATAPTSSASPSTTSSSSAGEATGTPRPSSSSAPTSSAPAVDTTPKACTVADRSHVHAERVGPAAFRAWADAGYECGGWVATFAFDDGYVPTSTDDYRHPQSALEWGYAQLTTTPTVHSVPAPKCGPFQSDFYVGDLVFHLPGGELGNQWRAGGVVLTNPACDTPTEEPTSTPTSPAPEPSDEPTGQPSAPVTLPSPSASPVKPGSTPAPTSTTTTPSSSPSLSTVARSASGGDSRTGLNSSPSEQNSGTLAYTGADAWPLVWAALVVIAMGVLLFLARRWLIARADRKDAQR